MKANPFELIQFNSATSVGNVATICTKITNIGNRSGANSALLFMIPPNAGKAGAPLKSLRGFEKVYLKPGESKMISFTITKDDVSLANNKDGTMELIKGNWIAQLGLEVQGI